MVLTKRRNRVEIFIFIRFHRRPQTCLHRYAKHCGHGETEGRKQFRLPEYAESGQRRRPQIHTDDTDNGILVSCIRLLSESSVSSRLIPVRPNDLRVNSVQQEGVRRGERPAKTILPAMLRIAMHAGGFRCQKAGGLFTWRL